MLSTFLRFISVKGVQEKNSNTKDKHNDSQVKIDFICDEKFEIPKTSSSLSRLASEGDDLVDHLSIPDNSRFQKSRLSVSAEAYGIWNEPKPFTPPVYSKSPEQEERIRNLIKDCIFFNALDEKELDIVVAAFAETKKPANEELIHQGDDGDCLYLIESGQLDVFIEKDGVQNLVTVMNPGEIVGELALLYNAPRAATVIGKTAVVLWELNRETFNHIVKDSAMRRREAYEAFLNEVDLFKNISTYDKSKLADALQPVYFNKNDVIIKEGDDGDYFYVIEYGKAEAHKKGQVVMQYERGSYFGELALLGNQKRAASVIATADMKCLSLHRKSFEHLLGSLEKILKSNATRYEQINLLNKTST